MFGGSPPGAGSSLWLSEVLGALRLFCSSVRCYKAAASRQTNGRPLVSEARELFGFGRMLTEKLFPPIFLTCILITSALVSARVVHQILMRTHLFLRNSFVLLGYGAHLITTTELRADIEIFSN